MLVVSWPGWFPSVCMATSHYCAILSRLINSINQSADGSAGFKLIAHCLPFGSATLFYLTKASYPYIKTVLRQCSK